MDQEIGLLGMFGSVTSTCPLPWNLLPLSGESRLIPTGSVLFFGASHVTFVTYLILIMTK